MGTDWVSDAYGEAIRNLSIEQISRIETGQLLNSDSDQMRHARVCYLRLMEQPGEVRAQVPADASVTTIDLQME